MNTEACSHKDAQSYRWNANNYQLQTSYIHAPRVFFSRYHLSPWRDTQTQSSTAEAIMCLWVYFNIWVPLQCFSIKDSVNINLCPQLCKTRIVMTTGGENGSFYTATAQQLFEWMQNLKGVMSCACKFSLLNIHPINLIRGLFIHAGYCKVLHGNLTTFLPSALLQRIWSLSSLQRGCHSSTSRNFISKYHLFPAASVKLSCLRLVRYRPQPH